ncbi:hypothetical protein GYMLUDRAFT_250802 [Collybiopsis luxurians FD-317 M1]|uniref:Mid2 domain-containing protein n=1 Tax=Collybiopsis luxurians FD-317 M1 TaxID=944289 RepID=A0A0D0CDF2_9AGAR|nr:hypothetical protein GYMLUDRAFT_250802 [Collybiopsis luxurians FD-317 M1]
MTLAWCLLSWVLLATAQNNFIPELPPIGTLTPGQTVSWTINGSPNNFAAIFREGDLVLTATTVHPSQGQLDFSLVIPTALPLLGGGLFPTEGVRSSGVIYKFKCCTITFGSHFESRYKYNSSLLVINEIGRLYIVKTASFTPTSLTASLTQTSLTAPLTPTNLTPLTPTSQTAPLTLTSLTPLTPTRQTAPLTPTHLTTPKVTHSPDIIGGAVRGVGLLLLLIGAILLCRRYRTRRFATVQQIRPAVVHGTVSPFASSQATSYLPEKRSIPETGDEENLIPSQSNRMQRAPHLPQKYRPTQNWRPKNFPEAETEENAIPTTLSTQSTQLSSVGQEIRRSNINPGAREFRHQDSGWRDLAAARDLDSGNENVIELPPDYSAV